MPGSGFGSVGISIGNNAGQPAEIHIFLTLAAIFLSKLTHEPSGPRIINQWNLK